MLIIDCGSTKTPAIHAIAHPEIDSIVVPLAELTPTHVYNSRGIIISGAPILLTEVDPAPYLQQFAFLHDIEVPVLGICFGHQIIGMMHGAAVERCGEDRAAQTIEQLIDSSLFQHIASPAQFMEDHCEAITLPQGFLRLASSAVCEVEAMKHPYQPIYGVQFHPEVSGDVGAQLIRNFCERCK